MTTENFAKGEEKFGLKEAWQQFQEESTLMKVGVGLGFFISFSLLAILVIIFVLQVF